MKAVAVADNADRDLGLLGEFAVDHGMRVRYLDRATVSGTTGFAADLLILLGSNRSAHEPRNAANVAAETALIRGALASGIPVIGICYGAQVLARALGGSSERGTIPECGWTPVFSSDEALCPSGSWGQMHHDVIVPAPKSAVIGWSSAGPQAFIDESQGARAIGWQFHPELTLDTFERWLGSHYSGSEDSDVGETLAHAAVEFRRSAPRAASLFRAAFQYLHVSNFERGVD
jgi:GMP synthase-like glutamine amidotransferase